MVKYRRSDIWKQRRKLHFRGQRWVDPNGNHIFLLHILNIRGTLIFLHWSEPKTAKSWAFYSDWRSTQHQLVGGWPTPLKNDGVRQWEGWHPIYEMESDKIPWFQTTNQSIYIYIYHDTRIIHIFHISVSYYPTISNIYIVYYQGFGDKNSAFKRYWSAGDGTWTGTPSQKNSVVDLNRTYGQSFFLQLNYRTKTDA